MFWHLTCTTKVLLIFSLILHLDLDKLHHNVLQWQNSHCFCLGKPWAIITLKFSPELRRKSSLSSVVKITLRMAADSLFFYFINQTLDIVSLVWEIHHLYQTRNLILCDAISKIDTMLPLINNLQLLLHHLINNTKDSYQVPSEISNFSSSCHGSVWQDCSDNCRCFSCSPS